MGSMCQTPEVQSPTPKLGPQTPEANSLMKQIYSWILNPSSSPAGAGYKTAGEATTTGFAPEMYNQATNFLHTALPSIAETMGPTAPGVGSGLINAETNATRDIGANVAATAAGNRMQSAGMQSDMLSRLIQGFMGTQPQTYQPGYTQYGQNPMMGLLQSLMGLGGTLGGAAILAPAACWVAAELYGFGSSRFWSARNYISRKPLLWKLYKRYGQHLALAIQRRPLLRKVVKIAFDYAARNGGVNAIP